MMQQELTLAYKQFLFQQNQKRIEEQEKQYSYYSGNKDKIEEYLREALEITYDSDDIAEMQLQWINLTKKIIDQMSVVYQNPAIRYLVDKDGNENEDATKYYNSILPENINSIDKLNHRLAKLSNCSLMYVTVNKKKKLIKYVINPIYKYYVDVDEEDNLTRVMYSKYYKNNKDEDELYTVVWTDTEHYLYDEYGNKQAVKNNQKKINPFNILPFAELKMSEGENYYGEGQNDLINVNEQVNLLLTKVVNSDIILGTEGTTLGINLFLNKKGIQEGGARKVRTGRKHPISVDNVNQTDVPPSLQHITTDPHITDIRDFIDWYIKYIASMKGLNPSAVLAQLKETSDYQRMMDAVDQMEMRKDDIEACRIFEKQRFEITRKIWNEICPSFGMKPIPEDLELKIDFAEIEIKKTSVEEQQQFEFELKHNMTTAIEFMMTKNPDLTKEEAEQLVTDNKKFNESIQPQQQGKYKSLIESIANNGQK